MDKLKTLNMCDFCAKEIETCGAKIIRAKEIVTDQGTQLTSDSILACDGYISPVEVLKKKFH